jgi:hypothetical protein
MGFSYYSPDTNTFTTGVMPDTGNPSQTNLLLLNILIELQVHTQYLAAMNPGIITDTPEELRLDAVTNYSTATT